MKAPLPFLLSIPHGGENIPDELLAMANLSHRDILEDGDAFSIPIYNLEHSVKKIIYTSIARAFLDLNRGTDQLPPEFPDGIFKSYTCYKKPAYKNGQFPAETLRNNIIEKYYIPYHKKIQKEIQYKSVKFAFDCHTMASVSPPVAKVSGQKRPLICLSNNGGKTCSDNHIRILKEIFITILDCKDEDVKINQPFSGGYIIQTYGMKPVPWIQIELNRSLYLTTPWFNIKTGQMDNHQLQILNQIIKEVLTKFADSLGSV